jgi:hypothetical protein
MNLFGLVVFAGASLCQSALRAADAISTVDYTQRNSPFTPGATVTPDKKKPQVDGAVQDKRVDKTVVDRKSAVVGDRRSPIPMEEARDKQVREKQSQRPEVREQQLSAFNHREARLSTSADSKKPVLVTKYQDSLVAASASNMARFPAMDRATGAKINRFVFRKNGSDSATLTNGAAVTPAGGGSVIQK